ncbi:MAG: hypothetical protein ACE5G9_12070 [Nitrospinales bacterium]
MLQDELNKIVEYAAGPELDSELRKAKKEYQEILGNIFEDDRSFENRMASFLEWYTFDRNIDNSDMTPLLAYIEKRRGNCPPETLEIYENLARYIHSIFIARKVKPGCVVVMELFDKIKYQVKEKQSEIVFRKDDIFEARIVPYAGDYYFTGTYCFHPREALRVIELGIKRLNDDKRKYENELKKLQKRKNSVAAETKKLDLKIEKTVHKIETTRFIRRIPALEEKKALLEKKRSDLKNEHGNLEKKITDLLEQKFNKEIPQARNRLIQQFSYMNLKWERFRQIDIKDIYRI